MFCLVLATQAFYAFVLQQGTSEGVQVSILDGTTNQQHMIEGLQVARGDFQLSEQEIALCMAVLRHEA
jgi:hypothetical protein